MACIPFDSASFINLYIFYRLRSYYKDWRRSLTLSLSITWIGFLFFFFITGSYSGFYTVLSSSSSLLLMEKSMFESSFFMVLRA